MATKTRKREASTRDLPAYQRARFVALVDAIAAKTGGKRRGWQRRVADALGISPSFVSKVLRQGHAIGDDTIERAEERLHLPREYFHPLDHESDEELEQRNAITLQNLRILLIAERKKHGGDLDQPPAGSLLDVHRRALRLVRANEPGVGAAVRSMLESVGFVKALSQQDDARLAIAFTIEMMALIDWIHVHPDEPTIASADERLDAVVNVSR